MRKPNCYIYPITSRLRTGVYNPYLDNFTSSSGKNLKFLNKDYPSDKGILDIFRYIGKVDFIFLNWVENIPEKKAGALQAILVVLLLWFKKILGIRVVWTMHNKFSHTQNHLFLKKVLFKQLLKRSDLIITHSSEGVRFAEDIFPGISKKIIYFQHPVAYRKDQNDLSITPNKYDILIWGSLSPYKGIDAFLDSLKKQNQLNNYQILVAGKALSESFYQRINSFSSDKLNIRNEFIDNDELKELINKSKVVLFTYSSDSVLSSGALMDSLVNGAFVIGPNKGAFADLALEGIIKTYKTHDDIPDIINNITDEERLIIKQKMNDFLLRNTWDNFATQLNKVIYKRFGLPMS